LKVALDELRGRLRAEERKTGRAVLAVLTPLAVTPSAGTAGSAALGAVVVKKAIALVLVVVGLIVVGTHLYKHHGRPSERAGASAGELGSGARRTPAAASSSLAHIIVTVTDSGGSVANAWVRCAPADGDVVVVKTASDGSASIDLAAGQWSIAASADEHEPGATKLAVVAGRDDHVRLVLAPGGQVLTGVVTDMTGGVVAGARIDAARLDGRTRAGDAIAVAFSDDDGRFKVALKGGAIVVAASHPEYAAQTRYVDLGTGGTTANFALVPGGAIEGVVRDAKTNQPVPGAAVYAASDAPPVELADTNGHAVVADAAGKFRFAGLRPGAYELFAKEGARSSRVPVGVDIGVAEQQTNIVVVVGASATIRGKVVDDSGAAAAQITIRAFGTETEAISDAAGAFVLEGLPPGRWALRGTSDRYLADGRAIVFLDKSDVDGIVVRVRRGLEVRGHVDPRERCDVEISKEDRDDPFHHDAMTTSADGEFHFAPFGAGPATLIAHCPNGDQGTTSITVGAGEGVIPVTPGASIDGRVVDKSGNPLAGVIVNAEPVGDVTRFEGGAMVSGLGAMTSTTGAFRIGGLRAASYRLSVLDTGLPVNAAKANKVALAAGQHATGIEVVVERPNGVIAGMVAGPDGAPVADAWVQLHQTMEDKMKAMTSGDDLSEGAHKVVFRGEAADQSGGPRDPPPVMTDARGHFEVTSLLRGRYQVYAEAEGGKLRGGAANVTTDAEITVSLAGVASLHGTVHGGRGPTDLFSVALSGKTFDGGSFTGGAFDFPRLDPGDYTIDVDSKDGTGQAKVRVSPDQAASVDIALVANGAVTGRVVDKAGNPVSGIGVALIPDQPPGQLQIALHEQPPTTGPDGRFQVEGAPGPRTLVVIGFPPTAKRGVPVASGTTVDVGDVQLDEPPKGTPLPPPR
jgi:protocatechuate 3,4-dioxygenase beta subunit